MFDDAAARLLPVLKALPGAFLPLLARGPGRPPIPDEPQAALLHPRRRDIFRLIQQEPGLSLSDIQRRLDIPAGAFYLHVEKLIACGLIEKRLSGTVARVYPAGNAPPPDAPALATETAKLVAGLILESPGLSSREIAEELNAPRRTVQVHLRNLLEAEFISQDKTGAPPVYVPTAKLRDELSRKEH